MLAVMTCSLAMQGNLISYFENSFIRSATRHEDVPELTELQLKALKAVEDLADSRELRMDYVLQPGDIQLLHNHSIVHARTAFVDHDDVSVSIHTPQARHSNKQNMMLGAVATAQYVASLGSCLSKVVEVSDHSFAARFCCLCIIMPACTALLQGGN